MANGKDVALVEGKSPVGGMVPKYIKQKGLLLRMVMLARHGMSRPQISKAVGLHPDTIYIWKDQAEKRPEDYPLLARWWGLMQRAEAQFEKQLVDKITDTAVSTQPNTWQAAAWMLERRDPESWGRRDKTEVRHTTDKPLQQVNTLVLIDADARDASRDFLRRVTGASPDLALGPGVRDESEKPPAE
jgi:hypothetical protein